MFNNCIKITCVLSINLPKHFGENDFILSWKMSDFNSTQYTQRLEMRDVVNLVLRNRMWWYGNVVRKDDDDWKCSTLEVKRARRCRAQNKKHGKSLWTRIWMICTTKWCYWIVANGEKRLEETGTTATVIMMTVIMTTVIMTTDSENDDSDNDDRQW